jgi:PPOX class probable F420-dependent enzyme
VALEFGSGSPSEATLQIEIRPVVRTNARNCNASRRRIRQAAPVSQRDQIKLSDAELLELLEGERVAIVTSLGPRGWPHSMPMWFVPREGEIWIWTYAKSQKVRNLERDARATVLIETGHEYGELRGAMIEAEAEIHRDFETVLGFAEDLTLRYAEGISSVEGDAKAALEAQAPKRVAIHFKPVRTATWDHRKLGGSY